MSKASRPLQRKGRAAFGTPLSQALADMSELAALVTQFAASVASGSTEIYNEFSLQHELGVFLRRELSQYKVQFDRNVRYFAPQSAGFVKREIDISVFAPDKSELKYAIELKYPRNGQYPEQMFSFCKDIAFLEQMKAVGFSRAALLIFVDDPLFYRGSGEGIYGLFRAGRPITGRVQKPTGAKNEHVEISGSYVVSWTPVLQKMHYTLVEVGDVG